MLLQTENKPDDHDYNHARLPAMQPNAGPIILLLLAKRDMPCGTKMQKRLLKRPLLLLRTRNNDDYHFIKLSWPRRMGLQKNVLLRRFGMQRGPLKY